MIVHYIEPTEGTKKKFTKPQLWALKRKWFVIVVYTYVWDRFECLFCRYTWWTIRRAQKNLRVISDARWIWFNDISTISATGKHVMAQKLLAFVKEKYGSDSLVREALWLPATPAQATQAVASN